MRNFALAALLLLAAVAAHAQIYKWQDENNKTVISDRPPPGKARQQKAIDADPAVAAPAQAAAPNAETGKTMADRELEFRKRQKEAKDAAEKTEKEQRAAAQRKESCEAARSTLRTLESGQRVSIRDEKGERQVLEDAQREQQIANARRSVEANCK